MMNEDNKNNGEKNRAFSAKGIGAIILVLASAYIANVMIIFWLMVIVIVGYIIEILFIHYQYRSAVRKALNKDDHFFDGFTDEDFEKFESTIEFTPLHFGPHIDTKGLTKGDLFHSGFQLLKFGTFPLLTFVAIQIIQLFTDVLRFKIAVVIAFASFLMLMMCLAGGCYFILRGLFRRKNPATNSNEQSTDVKSQSRTPERSRSR